MLYVLVEPLTYPILRLPPQYAATKVLPAAVKVRVLAALAVHVAELHTVPAPIAVYRAVPVIVAGSPVKPYSVFVAEEEADYGQGKISVTSPVGSALLNHKEKDIVEIKVPAGALKYKILKITR